MADYSVNSQEEVRNFEELLDLLAESVEKNKLFFRNKDEVLDIIKTLMDRLPSEMADSYDILEKEKGIISAARKEAEEIREEARYEADDIVKKAEEQAEKLASQDHIVELANQEAERIRNDALSYKSSMYESTNKYVVNVLDMAREKVSIAADSVAQLSDDLVKNKNNFIEFANKKADEDMN